MVAILGREAVPRPEEEAAAAVNIHGWRQFVQDVKTQVASIHHNFSAKLVERFGPTWRPSGDDPLWLLGRRYVLSPFSREEPIRSEGDNCVTTGRTGGCVNEGEGGSSSSTSPRHLAKDDRDFVVAWTQITRMTYRKGFAPMLRCVASPSAMNEQPQYIRLTSDAGWGCMIRVGQMLLATTLKRHFGLESGRREEGVEVPEELDSPLEQQFLDIDAKGSPFSIFSFIRAARGLDGQLAANEPSGHSSRRGRQLTQKLPGDWFGPTTISETIQVLVEENQRLRRSLAVYVEPDGVLYEDEVRALAQGEETPPPAPQATQEHQEQLPAEAGAEEPAETAPVGSWAESDDGFLVADASKCIPCGDSFGRGFEEVKSSSVEPLVRFEKAHREVEEEQGREAEPATDARWQRSVLLLFPLQLGLEKCVSKEHTAAVLRYFETPSSLGAMGGRPRMAHFFVGRQGHGLLYVDPHVVQPAATLDPASSDAKDPAGKLSPRSASETFRNAPTVQTIPVEQIETSISFAFYLRSEADLKQLQEFLLKVEEEEGDGPIRSERSRPLALTAPQDYSVDSFAEAFEEDLQEESEEDLTASPSEMPRCLVESGIHGGGLVCLSPDPPFQDLGASWSHEVTEVANPGRKNRVFRNCFTMERPFD